MLMTKADKLNRSRTHGLHMEKKYILTDIITDDSNRNGRPVKIINQIYLFVLVAIHDVTLTLVYYIRYKVVGADVG